MEDMNLNNENLTNESVENSVDMTPVAPATPVVGFQAVDAEGNVLGFISKADLVNEAKQALYADLAFMEQNRPMTLPANTEQLAASAAAATDVYEDQLPIKSDAPFIRGLDAAGNPILISKADIATVVGELIGTATPENDGLMSKKMATIVIDNWVNSEYIKIVPGNGTSTILAVTYARNGASFGTFFSITGPTVITSYVLKAMQDIKFYYDNTEKSFYLSKSDGFTGVLYVTSLINTEKEQGFSINKILGNLDISNKTEISALIS